MFELEPICNENMSHYSKYEKAFETDLKQYQSRIYPSETAEVLRWYHIKADEKYMGAIWLEKNANDDFAVLGIFIVDELYRNKGIGKAAIEQIIKTDLRYMHIKKFSFVFVKKTKEQSNAINPLALKRTKDTRKIV